MASIPEEAYTSTDIYLRGHMASQPDLPSQSTRPVPTRPTRYQTQGTAGTASTTSTYYVRGYLNYSQLVWAILLFHTIPNQQPY